MTENTNGDQTASTSEGNVSPEETTESTIDWAAKAKEAEEKAQKAEELANNYKIRAEKAEKEAKNKPEAQTRTETKSDLSPMDAIALMDARITNKEDIIEVSDYARFKGISIEEALKSSVVRTTLKEKSEQRTTAQATATGPGKRGSAKISDEQLIENASKGNLPQTDEEIGRLAAARMNAKANKKA